MPPRKGIKSTTTGPSKKQRTVGASPALQPTFISTAAEKRYERSIVSRKCIQERGFHNPMRSILETIKSNKWEIFAAQPEGAVVPVIREFYANAREHDNFKSLVRGKWVAFDRTTINNFYQLNDIPDDDFSKIRQQGADLNEMIQLLAKPGTEWTVSKSDTYTFPSKQLYIQGRIWHYFILAKLMPSSHVSSVHEEKAVLNYCIQAGLSVDVGKIIEESILNIAKMATPTGGFGHPSLIYGLCRLAGVPASPVEEIQHPKPAITPEMIRRISKNRGPEDEEAAPPEHDEPGTSASRRQPGSARTPGRASQVHTAGISDLHMEVRQLADSMRQCLSRQQQIYSRQGQLADYMTQCHVLLASALPTPVQLPPPPIFADEPEDESEEPTDTAAEPMDTAAPMDAAEEHTDATEPESIGDVGDKGKGVADAEEGDEEYYTGSEDDDAEEDAGSDDEETEGDDHDE